MPHKTTTIDIIWDHEPTPDDEARLLKAFEMIFRKIDEERRRLDSS